MVTNKVQRREIVDIDREIVFPKGTEGARLDILGFMDEIADKTKADLFLLESKSRRKDSESASIRAGMERSMDKRLQVHVYGDMESCENAKTRLLIMIDQILHRTVDMLRIELSLLDLIFQDLKLINHKNQLVLLERGSRVIEEAIEGESRIVHKFLAHRCCNSIAFL